MKIGFIGCGNMAKAMIGGVVQSKLVAPEAILASDGYAPSLEQAKETFGIETTMDNQKVAAYADVLVLAVKPQYYYEVIAEIAPVTSPHTVVVSITPGKTLEALEAAFGRPTKVVRTMPNTPALVGEGMTGMCVNAQVTDEEAERVKSILESMGKVAIVKESLIDAVVAVSGSAPAYVFMFIEAMADAAVSLGMDRKSAYTFAAQAVYGSAKMVLETGKHPGELKDMVCSPGGTTIQAVKALEEKGLRAAVMNAMEICANHSKGM